jgi:hypothetical protein
VQGYDVVQLFFLINVAASATCVPLLAGLWDGPMGQKVVTRFSMMMGTLLGLASCFVLSALRRSSDQTYRSALYQTFFIAFDYPPYVVPLVTSIVGLFLGAGAEALARAVVPGWENYPMYMLDNDRVGLDARLNVELGVEEELSFESKAIND